MTNLTDTQAVLLSSAAQREGGSLLPLPASLKPGGGATKALDALVTRGLAEERETSDPAATRRTEGEQRFGLFLTAAGAAAIGVLPPGADQQNAGNDKPPVQAPGTAAKSPSKMVMVLDLLRRPGGATLAELIAVTGWLPHTTRAALTGLRKKGHAVERGKRGDATCYSVAVQ